MRRRIVSFILSLAMVASIGLYFQTNQVMADETLARYVMDAETLPDGKIATVFIKGGSTTTNSYVSQNIVEGGALYYGVYDPVNNGWEEEIISINASEVSLALKGSTPHVAYVNSDKDIAYTYKSGDTWSVPDVIDSKNENDKQGELYFPDLAIDQTGYAHLSYFDSQGGGDEYYKRPDVMYATNKSGEFVTQNIVNCTGDYYSGEGSYFEVYEPRFFLNSSIGYGVSYRAHSAYKGWGSGWDHSYYVQFTNQTGSYDFDKNATRYGVCTNGSEVWELEYYSGAYNIIKFALGTSAYETSVAATVTHTGYCSNITLDNSDNLYFAGIDDTSAVFYQNGVTTDVTAETARCSYNRVFTVLSGNDQYLVYTGADTDNSLIFLKFDGSDISEFKVPNIMPEPTPNAVFEATGTDSGILNDVTAGMKYSIDGGETWIDIEDTSVTFDSGITVDKGIKVYQPATSAMMSDSEIQNVVVTKAATPELVPVQPSVIDGKGSIPTTSDHEFSTDGTTYTACTGEQTGLVPGTYYVRAVASGTALTSDPQEIEIVAFVPEQEETPEAYFDATGPDRGVLVNVGQGMKYSIDGGSTWHDITATREMIGAGISVENGIKVYMPGNGTTTIDSDIQTIDVRKADRPSLTVTQPAVINGKGAVETSSRHEWSEDGTSYAECTGELTDLEPGTYYVRVAGLGNVLASDPQEIEIVAFVPEQEDTPQAVLTKTGDESFELSNVASGMKYSIDGTNWVDITGTTAVIESGVTTGTIIKIYMPGNGTTTIDSDVQEIKVPLYYKVTFDTNGGNEIAAQYVVSGEKAAKPDDPVREGMVFNGWYMDDEFEYAFDYSNPIFNNITIYADWYAYMAVGVYNASNPGKECGKVGIETSREGIIPEDATMINLTVLDGTVTFTAKPEEGYKFVGWYEGIVGESSFVEFPSDALLSDEGTYTCDAGALNICAVFECASHQWEEKICKATFTEPGCIYQVCSVCGAEETITPLLQVTKVSLEASSYTYTGSAIEPKVTVANASEELSADCYTVEYSNNVEIGTGLVKVTLKGDYYEGSKTLTFQIKAKPATPTPTKVPAKPTASPTPTKAPAKPTATPTKTPTKAPAKPTATPTKTPTKAPAKPTATATPKPDKNSIKRAKVEFQYSDYEYREGTEQIKPAIKVIIDGTQLKSKTDFTGDLKNNDRPGTGSITLTGQGKYKDSVTLDFNIVAVVTCGKTLDLSKIKAWKGATFAISNKTIASVDKSGKITGKQAGSATVTVTLKDGKKEKFSVRVLYKDVTDINDFWYEPTNALTAMGIVKGYDNQTNFKPANECSRAQMVTFLWRLAGEPAPSAKTTSFKDIKSSDYFYKPVLWAVEKGITTGVSKEKFDPQGICTRAQTVTFLWRMAGKPEPKSKTCKFSDVKSKDYFYKATIWASEKSIVAGYSDGTFKPQGKCLRRQMVTFLYKYDKYANNK
ncbi:MAG: S-layer homology domain-containing protein [Clostridiales bacterium]|nr:S-layer homology domain-containing protein [Clostridiales bacterium]